MTIYKYNLTVIIPTFNSSKYIVKNLNKIFFLLKKNFKKFNIVVVDDGSTDNSVLTINQNIDFISFLTNKRNKGKGYCIKKALKNYRNSKYYVFIDDDLPYLNSFINLCKKLLLGKSDMIIANRIKKITYGNLNIELRKIYSSFINFIIFKYFSIPYKDTQAGLKGFNFFFPKKFKKIITNRFLFDLEFFLICIENKGKIDLINVSSKAKNYNNNLIFNFKTYFFVMSDLITIYKKYIK